MREVMEQTKVEKSVCEHVWGLVNPRGSDRIDKSMFAMAMHFLYNKKKQGGGLELPPMVPEETLMSIDPENYFKMKQQMMQMRPPQPSPEVK